jgi:hypothetical protein
MLDIENSAEYSDVITGIEFHTHKPYASSTFKNNDEIRIPISQQDIITAPFDSTLHIVGKVSGKKQNGDAADVYFINNAVAFLFDDIRYEIGGVEIDRIKNAGITTTIKNLLSIQQGELESLKNACWLGAGKTDKTKEFSFSVPLHLLLGFAEDYKRIIANVRQELILLRSSTDSNAVYSENATQITLEITGVYWRVPHVTVSDPYRLKLLKMIEKDTKVHLPFRSWELHEYPSLPQTTLQSWTVKTSSQLEKPRYIVVGFQTDRKNNTKKDMSCFDACDLKNIKVYLNSQYYPYDNVHGDWSIFYEMFFRFQSSYYGRHSYPAVDKTNYKEKTPLYVIDCSKQNDAIKTGPVDVRVDFEAGTAFAANTSLYCLLLHDSHMTYSLLTGTVNKVTV